jgi:hypothetical protein
LGCTGSVQLSSLSPTGLRDSADTDVRRPKLYCAGYPSETGGGLRKPEVWGSDEESPPKGPLNTLPVDDWPPKFGVVGEVMVSFSSSSATLCIAPVSSREEPKGFECAPKGLLKFGPDMSDGFPRRLLLWKLGWVWSGDSYSCRA